MVNNVCSIKWLKTLVTKQVIWVLIATVLPCQITLANDNLVKAIITTTTISSIINYSKQQIGKLEYVTKAVINATSYVYIISSLIKVPNV